MSEASKDEGRSSERKRYFESSQKSRGRRVATPEGEGDLPRGADDEPKDHEAPKDREAPKARGRSGIPSSEELEQAVKWTVLEKAESKKRHAEAAREGRTGTADDCWAIRCPRCGEDGVYFAVRPDGQTSLTEMFCAYKPYGVAWSSDQVICQHCNLAGARVPLRVCKFGHNRIGMSANHARRFLVKRERAKVGVVR